MSSSFAPADSSKVPASQFSTRPCQWCKSRLGRERPTDPRVIGVLHRVSGPARLLRVGERRTHIMVPQKAPLSVRAGAVDPERAITRREYQGVVPPIRPSQKGKGEGRRKHQIGTASTANCLLVQRNTASAEQFVASGLTVWLSVRTKVARYVRLRVEVRGWWRSATPMGPCLRTCLGATHRMVLRQLVFTRQTADDPRHPLSTLLA